MLFFTQLHLQVKDMFQDVLLLLEPPATGYDKDKVTESQQE